MGNDGRLLGALAHLRRVISRQPEAVWLRAQLMKPWVLWPAVSVGIALIIAVCVMGVLFPEHG